MFVNSTPWSIKTGFLNPVSGVVLINMAGGLTVMYIHSGTELR